MRDWVLVVLEGSSRNKASIRDYKILRNKFGTSIFRETGLNLSIRRAYGEHTAGLRWYLANGVRLWVYCEAWRSRTWYLWDSIQVWRPHMATWLKPSVDPDHLWRHRWHPNEHQSGSCRSERLHATKIGKAVPGYRL